MGEPMVLVAMRLADMFRVHPAQDNSHVCSECGERVGIYPTGQKALRDHPGAKVVCVACAMSDRQAGDEARPAGSWDEIVQESRDSRDVGKA